MKVTVYELLGLVKDGKAPKKFKYDGYVWTYNYESSAYWNGKGMEFEDYMDDGLMKYLNDKVEILEEEKKIPEKLNWKPKESMAGQLTQKEQIEVIARRTEKLKKEFNNLLDYLKSKGE